MRFAYADPPYIGQAKRHYGDHADYAGEVDHAALVARLEADYQDGWALSATSASLQYLLSLCPAHARVLVWAKTNPKFFPPSRLQYAWEPVILCRQSKRPMDAPVTRDWIACARVSANHNNTHGSKPQAFCYWLFDSLGLTDDDELDDIFPGSGAVSDHLASWRAQLRMPAARLSPKRRAGRGGQMPIGEATA